MDYAAAANCSTLSPQAAPRLIEYSARQWPKRQAHFQFLPACGAHWAAAAAGSCSTLSPQAAPWLIEYSARRRPIKQACSVETFHTIVNRQDVHISFRCSPQQSAYHLKYRIVLQPVPVLLLQPKPSLSIAQYDSSFTTWPLRTALVQAKGLHTPQRGPASQGQRRPERHSSTHTARSGSRVGLPWETNGGNSGGGVPQLVARQPKGWEYLRSTSGSRAGHHRETNGGNSGGGVPHLVARQRRVVV